MSTIAVDATVHVRLQHLKQEWDASSLNEVLRHLLDETQKIPRSRFGSDPALPRMTRKLRDEMWA